MKITYTGYVNGQLVSGELSVATTTTDEEIYTILAEIGIVGVTIYR